MDKIVHGEKRTKLYDVWVGMRQRCYNANAKGYSNYGGRGIKICDEWQDFVAFRHWAYANGYQNGLSIDRIDNDGDYEPYNCRWATREMQLYNRRITVRIEYENRSYTIPEIAEKFNIPENVVYYRFKHGYSSVDIVSKPVANMPLKAGKSGERCIYYHKKDNLYQVIIHHKYYGCFKDINDAIKARDDYYRQQAEEEK